MTSNSEKIKPIALAVIELRLAVIELRLAVIELRLSKIKPKGISQLLTQSVENSIK